MINTTPSSNSYVASNALASSNVFVDVFMDRDPTSNDINYNTQKKWLNTTNGAFWILQNFTSSGGIVLANWIKIGSISNAESLTGNSGGAVFPDSSSNINFVGDGTTINIVGNPATHTLTASTTGAIATTYTENSGTASPSSGNLNVLGGTNVTTSGSGSTVTINSIDLHTAKFIVGDLSKGANYTTIAAAYAAAVSAGAPQTVFLQDGVYVENITLTAGINICSFGSSGYSFADSTGSANVIIQGTLTVSFTGTVTIFGIELKTNGAAAIATSGSNYGILSLINCTLNAYNATGATLNSALSTIFFNGCSFTNSSSNALWTETTSSGINIINCIFICVAATASMATGAVVFLCSQILGLSITTTSTGNIAMYSCFWGNGGNTLLTTSGSSTSIIYNTILISGTASAISVGSATTVVMAADQVQSSNTNAITGAGTLLAGLITFISSSTINTTTVTKLTTYGGNIV